MNKTIKYLLEREISRWIVVIYDKYVTIDKSRVDVKNDNIRFGIASVLLISYRLRI